MLGQGATEGAGLVAAHPEQTLVGRQHYPVKVDHVSVFVVGEYVVEGDVLDVVVVVRMSLRFS